MIELRERHAWPGIAIVPLVLFWGWHICCAIALALVIYGASQGEWRGSAGVVGLQAVQAAGYVSQVMLAWGGGAVAFGSMVWFARRSVHAVVDLGSRPAPASDRIPVLGVADARDGLPPARRQP